MNSFTQLKKYAFFLSMFLFVIDFSQAQTSYFFYSFTADPWTFNRRNDDGTNPIAVYTPPVNQINESAVDGSLNKVYFYESGSNYIFKSDFDGTNKTTITTTAGSLYSLAAGNGYVFYSYLSSPYSVRRCNADGTNDIELYLNPSFGSVKNLAYDAANNYLYYYELAYDNTNNRIFRTDANGSNMTVIYNNCPKVQSLAAGAGYVYFAYFDNPWTFNRRTSAGASEILLYTPPTGSVNECVYDATLDKIYFYDTDVAGSKTIFKANADGSGRTSVYSGFTQTMSSLSAPSARPMTFTNGSGFTQSLTPNSTNQVLGRFQLTGSASGAVLTAAAIQLNNARTGLSNLKLWASTDAAFGGDTQLGSTVAADPGAGNSVTFSSFSSSIGTSTYYFLTGDIAASPSGTVQGVIVQNSNLTISGGTLTGTISSAVLSSGTMPLPIELTGFTASLVSGKATLQWQTATEVNNYGFEIEKRALGATTWIKVDFVKGNGTSSSPKLYSYTDETAASGTYVYRLKQVDNGGAYKYTGEVEVIVSVPKVFALNQNYPNPFNPSTEISYQLPAISHVQMAIYDLLGGKVTKLVDGVLNAGAYKVTFDGAGKSSGVYFVRYTATPQDGSKPFTQTMKMLLTK